MYECPVISHNYKAANKISIVNIKRSELFKMRNNYLALKL